MTPLTDEQRDWAGSHVNMAFWAYAHPKNKYPRELYHDRLEAHDRVVWALLKAAKKYDPARSTERGYLIRQVRWQLLKGFQRQQAKSLRRLRVFREADRWRQSCWRVDGAVWDPEPDESEVVAAGLVLRVPPAHRPVAERMLRGLSNSEISRELGVTRQRVGQIVGEVRKRLAPYAGSLL